MNPKIRLFLGTRDQAYARGDSGVVRSMNAELRRFGISDEATLANPTGKRKGPRREALAPTFPKNPGRPKLPRCEHGEVVDRCLDCNPELATA